MRAPRLLRCPAGLEAEAKRLLDGFDMSVDALRNGQCLAMRLDLLGRIQALAVIIEFEPEREAFNQDDQTERFGQAKGRARF